VVVEVGAAVRQIDGDVVHRHAGDHQVVRGAGANSAPATISRTSWMAEGVTRP